MLIRLFITVLLTTFFSQTGWAQPSKKPELIYSSNPIEQQLFVAAQKGDLKMVKQLLNSGVNPNVRGVLFSFEKSPLMVATQFNQEKVVRYLVSRGANIHYVDKLGHSVLAFAMGPAKLDTIKFLIAKGANPHIFTADPSSSKHKIKLLDAMLLRAAELGKIALFHYTLSQGANLHIQLKNGHNALAATAKNGHLELVSFLISKGANLETQEGVQGTPLIQAAGNGHVEIVKLLIAKGADVNAQTYQNNTALISPNKNSLEISQILVEHGAKIDHKGEYDRTALHIAAGYHRPLALVDYLLSKGADINVQDHFGITPLHMAIQNRDFELVKHLIKRGANINIKAKDDTSLYFAVKARSYKITKLLLEQRFLLFFPLININEESAYGRRVIDFDFISKDIRALLIQHGAKKTPTQIIN